MPYDHKIYLTQVGLKKLGFDPGPPDGLDGPRTRAAFQKSLAARFPENSPAGGVGAPPRPAPNYHSKVRVFGKPGRESMLKRVSLPWKMKIAGMPGRYRTTIRMHKLIADIMIRALEEILAKKGWPYVQKHGLDIFGGDYVNRAVRGGRATSDHAWGIALDLNPAANGNHHQWSPGKAAPNGTHEMPRDVVDIFRKHGFQVGFRKSNGRRRDMMHIAYVDRP